MKKLKGYRSIIAQAPTIIFALLSVFGIIVPDADQATIAAAYSTIIAVVMRAFTTTEMGKSE